MKALNTLLLGFSCLLTSIGTNGDPCDKNLAAPDFFWGSVLSQDRVPWIPGKGLVSSGPWYIDINHREAALLIGPLVIWANTPDGIPGVPDLAQTNLRINLKFDYGGPWLNEYDVRKGGQIVFWFQSKVPSSISGAKYVMPDRFVNYVFNRNFLTEATAGTPVELSLTDNLNDWTCLGRNQLDTRSHIGSAAKYTCALNRAEFRQALYSPENMGVVFLLPRYHDQTGVELQLLNEKFPARTPTMGNSKFTLREFVCSSAPGQRKVSARRDQKEM